MKQNNHKHPQCGKKLLLSALCVGLLLPAVLSNPIRALTPPKDEVIYGKLLSDGSVEQVYVVNAFSMSEKGLVLDEGNYTEVLNLSNNNPIDYKNGTIAVSADQGRFYYQGNLRSRELPWLLKIDYRLDGQSIPAAGLSGRNGALEMRIKVDPNTKVDDLYFKNFVLQIAMTVNADKAINLKAEGATIANAGGDKVINWMVLPGQTAEYLFTADITNFSMAGLQISAVPLNLKFEMPDMTQFTGQFADLRNGVAKLNSGAQELLDGANALASGAAESAAGAQTFANGGPKLAAGLSDLQGGITEYGQGLSSYVDGVTQLSGGSEQLLTGFRQFADGLDALKVNGDSLSTGSTDIAAGLAQMAAQLGGGQSPDSGSGAQISDLAAGSQQFYEGLKGISEGLTAIVGPLSEASAGLTALSSGLNEAAAALPNLSEGLHQANAGFSAAIDSIVVPSPVNGAELSGQLSLSDPTNPDVQVLLGYIEGSSAQTSSGLSALKSGLSDLLSAYQNLGNGLDSASSGIAEATSQLATIAAGFAEISTNLQTLNGGLSTLLTNYAAINDGIAALTGQLGQLPQLVDGITQLSSQYASFDTGLKAYISGVSQVASSTDALDSGLSSLNSGLSQLNGSGTKLKDGASGLSSGASSAAEGVSLYSDGAQALADGLDLYKDGIQSYASGMSDYASGTQQFEDSTKNIDVKIEETMNAEIEKMIGGEFTLKSFTSPQNSSISSVQFVLMTPEIAAPLEAEAAPDIEPQLSFWDRLLGLFR